MSEYRFNIESGNIAPRVSYEIVGGTGVEYNSMSYNTGDRFVGSFGITTYTKMAGSENVYEVGVFVNFVLGLELLPVNIYNQDSQFITIVSEFDTIIYYFESYTETEFETETIEHDFYKIEWQNSNDIDNIRFADGFKDELYFNSNIEKPEYLVIEEGSEDGDGNKLFYFQKFDKRSKLIIPAYESTADVIALLPAMDVVKLYITDAEYIVMRDINVEIEPQENSLWLICTVTFSERTVIKRFNDNNLN